MIDKAKLSKDDGGLDLGKVEEQFPHYLIVATDENGRVLTSLHGKADLIAFAYHKAMNQDARLEKWTNALMDCHESVNDKETFIVGVGNFPESLRKIINQLFN